MRQCGGFIILTFVLLYTLVSLICRPHDFDSARLEPLLSPLLQMTPTHIYDNTLYLTPAGEMIMLDGKRRYVYPHRTNHVYLYRGLSFQSSLEYYAYVSCVIDSSMLATCTYRLFGYGHHIRSFTVTWDDIGSG